MEKNPVLETHDLTKEWGNLVAVNQVNLTVAPGSVVALVGPNGAGKTTLLKMLAGLLPATSGTAKVCGIDVSEHPREVHKCIGFLPDFFGLYQELTVVDYLDYFARAYGTREPRKSALISDILEKVGLTAKRDSAIEHLSRGMRQRVGIARAVINDPRLLLLDEPASGLDPEARHELQALFQRLSGEGHTLVVSSHILTELEAYSDHVIMMSEGRVVASGAIGEIQERNPSKCRVLMKLVRGREFIPEVLQGFAHAGDFQEQGDNASFTFAGTERELSELLAALVKKGILLSRFEPDSSIQNTYLNLMKGTSR